VITIRKLTGLPREGRLRKAARILREAGEDLSSGRRPDPVYLRELGRLLLTDGLPGPLEEEIRRLSLLRLPEASSGPEAFPDSARFCDSLHYRILDYLGSSPADWDLRDPRGGLDPRFRRIFPFRVYLDDLRSPFNVGSVFRTAEAFGVEKIWLSPATPGPDHPRAVRTSRGADSLVPWERGELAVLPPGEPVFALELGGKDLNVFDFPVSGTVILGSEELGISPEAERRTGLSLGRVSIPLFGAKGSLNVSVAFGILMHAWSRRTGKLSAEAPGQFPAG